VKTLRQVFVIPPKPDIHCLPAMGYLQLKLTKYLYIHIIYHKTAALVIHLLATTFFPFKTYCCKMHSELLSICFSPSRIQI